MKTLATILLAASAPLAPTSIAARLAADPRPRRMRSDPREGTINEEKKSLHRRRRRRRNKSTRWAQRNLDSNDSNEGIDIERRGYDSNVHSNDNIENAMQEEEIVEATFGMYVPPGKITDAVITMDDTVSMPAVDGFVLPPFQETTIDADAELGLGLQLPTDFGSKSNDAPERLPSSIDVEAESGLGLELSPEFERMSMPLDALEMAPITLNGMSMEFVEPHYQDNTGPTLNLEEFAITTTRPAGGEARVVESTTSATFVTDRETESTTAADTAVSMEFTEPPFTADRENGSTTAATMAASSGETITTTTASRESKMLPPSPSDATATTSIEEEEEPEDMITIVGEHLTSSSSMKSPILIATMAAGVLSMMW